MRTLPLTLALCSTLAVTACGERVAPAQDAFPPALQAPITYADPVPQAGCQGESLPPAHAGLLALRADGSTRFSVAVPPPGGDQPQAGPVEDGAGIYLGSGGSLVGLDLDDGSPRWERRDAGSLYGLWLSDGLLVALLDQVGDHAHVLGVDPADGSVRWGYDVPGQGLLGGQDLTDDGGLAWVHADRSTQVLDLTTGTIRWTQPTTHEFPGLAALSGVVLRTTDDAVVAYDSLTGEVRSTTPASTAEVTLLPVGDLAIQFQTAVGPALDGQLVATGADGRERWRVPGDPLTNVVALNANRVVLQTETGLEPHELIMLDATTGERLWSEPTLASATSALSDTVLLTVSTQLNGRVTEAVARSVVDGHVLWQAPMEGYPSPLLTSDAVFSQHYLDGGASEEVVLDARTGAELSRTRLVGFALEPVESAGGALVQSQDLGRACFSGDQERLPVPDAETAQPSQVPSATTTAGP